MVREVAASLVLYSDDEKLVSQVAVNHPLKYACRFESCHQSEEKYFPLLTNTGYWRNPTGGAPHRANAIVGSNPTVGTSKSKYLAHIVL